MFASLTWLRRRALAISLDELSFSRRGFHSGDGHTRARLEQVGSTVVAGYHAALEDAPIGAALERVDRELRGFAYEGAAMALALIDGLTPWSSQRWAHFARGPASAHAYMLHVGVGLASARLGRRLDLERAEFDPLLRWLVADGYGFHAGYFDWPRHARGQRVDARASGYAARAFDQGLGRSLWFVECATPERIARAIALFPSERRDDLWSGVGLACAYAGGVEAATIEELLACAADAAPHVAQGAAFAAQARERASNPCEHTERACTILCGTSAASAARGTVDALEDLPSDGDVPAYEVWRTRVRQNLCASGAIR